MRDYLYRIPKSLQDLSIWVDEGKLKTRECVLEGIESFPTAVTMLFAVQNQGRLLIRL